mmetsp:Transcript_718/g.1687  ORF Transcript_718/g.1687 Transcript_718/m.1687 type:complete len:209 (-) Transcript_718:131-757(-)
MLFELRSSIFRHERGTPARTDAEFQPSSLSLRSRRMSPVKPLTRTAVSLPSLLALSRRSVSRGSKHRAAPRSGRHSPPPKPLKLKSRVFSIGSATIDLTRTNAPSAFIPVSLIRSSRSPERCPKTTDSAAAPSGPNRFALRSTEVRIRAEWSPSTTRCSRPGAIFDPTLLRRSSLHVTSIALGRPISMASSAAASRASISSSSARRSA